jgi:Mlc titration factor MtfA (ptsG expression regulator)
VKLASWLASLWRRLRGQSAASDIPDALWQQVQISYAFIAALDTRRDLLLRDLSARFLRSKRFHGAAGLVVTDLMALAVAAQACLLLLGWAERRGPRSALRWYGDFVGIVLHPDAMLATRERIDGAGVVHRWREGLLGEAMERGPVTLAWRAVADAGGHDAMERGSNVVIHEFAHKLDMQAGGADGCPPLPPRFMGATSARAARRRWRKVLEPAYRNFRERWLFAQRFGGEPPWLDAYGATAPAEFFAVACEAYFVNREALSSELPSLPPLFDAFFSA